MKAEHNSIMSGSAAAVILGIAITIIPWFFPISIWTKIILVHNHPSGDPNPSREDIYVTDKIISSGKEIGIEVLDSFIIGKDKYWNWKEKS